MRTTIFALFILCALPATSEETQQKTWHFTPGIAMTKYFPGSTIKDYYNGVQLFGLSSFIYPPPAREYRYGGTGLNFSVRAFNEELPNVALTLGAGATWYYAAERTSGDYVIASSAAVAQAGIGEQLGNYDFMTFPVSLGLQFVFPYEGRENLMLFGGIDGNVQLISGNVSMGEQAKLGYTVTGGFAVKIFEFAVRYTQFSDMKNLGVSLGFRLNSFSL
jgi:hypothetical protein